MTPSVIAELIRQKQLPKPFVQPDATASLPMGAPSSATAPVGSPPVTAPPVPEPGPMLPPVAAPTITAPPTQWTPPSPTWISPPPLQMQTPPPSPLMEASNQFHATEPGRLNPQFSRGKIATVLDAIASGLAGAGPGGAKAGLQTAQTLRDIPFNRAHADWAQRAADYDRQIKEEQARTGVGLKELGAGVQQRKVETTAEAAAAKQKLAEGKETREAEQFKNTDEYRKAKAAQEVKHQNEVDAMNKIHQLAYQKKVDAEVEAAKNKETPDVKREKDLALFGKKAAITTAQAGPRAAAAAKARKGVEDEVDPVVIDKFQKLTKDDPMSVMDNVKLYPPKQRAQILAKIDLPKNFTGQEKQTFDNAKTTLLHVNTLRDLAQDPYIKAHMGPILGRVQTAEGKIGGKPIGATPEESEKEGNFLNYITYVMAWESKQLGGARPAWQLMQEIKKTGAKAAMDPSRFAGALDAVESSVGNNMQAVLSRSPSTSGQKPAEGSFVGRKKVE